jgi:hypothetical protein
VRTPQVAIFSEFDFYASTRVADEQLCEHRHVIDQLSMMGQPGLLPEAAEA